MSEPLDSATLSGRPHPDGEVPAGEGHRAGQLEPSGAVALWVLRQTGAVGREPRRHRDPLRRGSPGRDVHIVGVAGKLPEVRHWTPLVALAILFPMMRTSVFLGLVLSCSWGCGDDGDGESGADSADMGADATGVGTTDEGGEPTGSEGTTAGADSDAEDSASASAGDTTTDTAADTAGTDASSDSTGDPNACDPVVPGEWNACVDADGNIDNTLCNWMGTGGSTGFLSCLSASSNPDANVCFIRDCEDACDCFAPPPTGNAPVVCAEILADNGRGCALDCSEGQQCPDGMECLDGLCFHPPAG